MGRLFPENFGFGDWAGWAYVAGKSAYETVAGEMLEGGTQRIEALRAMGKQFQFIASQGAGGVQQPPANITIQSVGTIIGAPGDPRLSPFPHARPGDGLYPQGRE